MDRHDTGAQSPTNSQTPQTPQSQSLRSKVTQCINSERGQTSIDLLIAVTIFFTAISLVVLTSPGAFFPAGLSATDKTTTADSIAIELQNDILGSNGSTTLDPENVEEFFDGDDNTITDEFTIPEGTQVFVQIEYVGSGDPPRAFDGANSLQRGNAPGGMETTVTRGATLDNKPVTITVTVWLA